MGKKGGKEAKKDAKKEVDPASLPQLLKEAKGAFQHNEHIEDVFGEGSGGPCGTISHLRGGVSDAALGVEIFTSGRHRWRVVISKTTNGSAYGMVIGVADAREGIKVTDAYGGAAWGIHTTTSRFTSTLDCYERGFLGLALMPPEADGTLGLKGYAEGSYVWVEVDMDRRTLSYTINDGSTARAPVRLPPSVRPWVLLNWEGDRVTMHPSETLAPSHGVANS